MTDEAHTCSILQDPGSGKLEYYCSCGSTTLPVPVKGDIVLFCQAIEKPIYRESVEAMSRRKLRSLVLDRLRNRDSRS